MKIPFKRRIPAQFKLFDDRETKYKLLLGGYGAGKTFWLWREVIRLSFENKGVPGGILSPSLPEFKRDFLPMALEEMQLYIPNAKYYSAGRYGIHFRFPWTKAPIFVFSAERAVKGPNLGWGVINEMSLMPKDVVFQFFARMRVAETSVPQRCLGGTPEDEYGWLEEWIDTREKAGDIHIETATSFDNPFNIEGYADDLLSNLDEDAAQIYVYGKPGRIGHDYFFYAYKPEINDYEILYDENETVHATLDFNVGRMSCGFAHVWGEGDDKQIGYFDECVLLGERGNTEEMAEEIIRRYGRANVIVTCDASGKARKTSGLSDVQTLEQHGLKVRYKRSNPRIRKSQLLTNGLLARRKILLNPYKCPIMKKDLSKVKQKDDFEIEKKVAELTHMSDGMRYLADFEFPNWLDRGTRQKYRELKYGERIG